MKKVWMKWIIITFIMVSGVGITSMKAQRIVSHQAFYDELQPYGTWIQYPGYGNVWLPHVDNDFVPYGSNGYWVHTEYGNTWVSDYAWGWAPFHYGRWFYDDFYGWMWIPDTVWAPAWVVWRRGGGYYGWAPLMPGFSINVSVSYYSRIPHYYWNFVPYRYITYRHVHHHCVPRAQVVNVIHHTTIVNNYTDNRRYTYFTGPSRSDIERTSHSQVDVYKINNRTRPGASNVERDQLNLYRPEIDNSRDSKMRSIPERVAIDNRDTKNFGSRGESNAKFKDSRMPDNMRRYTPDGQQWNDKSKMDTRTRDINIPDRSKQSENQNLNGSYKNFREEQLNRQAERSQTTKQVQKQNANSWESNYPQQRDSRAYQYNQDRDQKMMKEQSQQVDRQNSSQFNRQNSQQERFSGTPNYKQNSVSHSQRGQQVQKNSSVRTPQPTKNSGGNSRSGRR